MKKRIVLDIDIDTDQEGITGILPRDMSEDPWTDF
jgi:hypothetical protein